MEWEALDQFVDPDGLQGDATVESQDLALDPQPDRLEPGELAEIQQQTQSAFDVASPGSDEELWIQTAEHHTSKASPLNLPPSTATAPTLPRTRAPARANLMSNSLALRRALRPAAPPTQAQTAGVQQTLLQHISTLQGRVQALENHVEAMNKTLERRDPNTWECLREMVQEMVQEHGQVEGET